MIDAFEKRRADALRQAAAGVEKAFANEPLSERRRLTLEFAKNLDPRAFGLTRAPLAGPNAPDAPKKPPRLR